MHILCPIDETIYEEKITRGKYVGQMTRWQWVVAADKYNWSLAKSVLDKDDNVTNVIGEKYFASFRILFKYIVDLQKELGYNLDMLKLIARVDKALAEKTKKGVMGAVTLVDNENWKEVGEKLSAYYKVRYAIDEKKDGDITSMLWPKKKKAAAASK